MILVTLPWPSSALTPNAKRRSHWSVYRPAIKAARLESYALTTLAIPLARKRELAAMETIPVKVTFFPPDRRKRDDDGMIGAFKHARDGIADAIGQDDHKFRPTYVVAAAEKPGRVEIEIGE